MRPRRRRPGSLLTVLVVAGVASVSVLAFTAANVVASSRATNQSQAITANTLKPTECNGITLTAVVTGSGTFNGTAAAELVLGSSGIDVITARGGNDCVLGGGGNDAINGGAGTDVCIGGPGTDTFTNCETQYQ